MMRSVQPDSTQHRCQVGDRVRIVNPHSDEIVPAPVTSLSPLAQWAFRNRREWSLNCRDTFGNGSERIVYVRKAACKYNHWSDAWTPAPGFNAGTDELEIVIPKAVQ